MPRNPALDADWGPVMGGWDDGKPPPQRAEAARRAGRRQRVLSKRRMAQHRKEQQDILHMKHYNHLQDLHSSPPPKPRRRSPTKPAEPAEQTPPRSESLPAFGSPSVAAEDSLDEFRRLSQSPSPPKKQETSPVYGSTGAYAEAEAPPRWDPSGMAAAMVPSPAAFIGAVVAGEAKSVRKFLADGADPNETKMGLSAVVRAAQQGHAAVVQALGDAGADLVSLRISCPPSLALCTSAFAVSLGTDIDSETQ